jgi:hypothetical protein
MICHGPRPKDQVELMSENLWLPLEKGIRVVLSKILRENTPMETNREIFEVPDPVKMRTNHLFNGKWAKWRGIFAGSSGTGPYYPRGTHIQKEQSPLSIINKINEQQTLTS